MLILKTISYGTREQVILALVKGYQARISKLLLTISILFLNHSLMGTCPVDEADLLSASTFTISAEECFPTSPGPTYTFANVACCANSAAQITIQSGGILNINMSDVDAQGIFSPSGIGASITVENGGILNIINGSLGIRNGAIVTVNSGGTVNVATNVFVGSPSSFSAGTLILNGEMNVGGSFNLNGLGSLQGAGTLTAGTINEEGGADDQWTGSCSGGCSTLPVELVSFSGTVVEQGCQLSWTTASETNNEGFELHKSLDGENFHPIAFIAGNGTSNESHHYEYTDRSFNRSSYYRLKQNDFDGNFEYHHILFVQKASDLELSFYPNPVVEEIHIAGNTGAKLDFTLTNMAGQRISAGKAASLAQTEEQLNQLLPELRPATYVLTLTAGLTSKTLRIQKVSQ